MIGIGGLLLGVVAMLFAMVPYRDFFRRKPYTEVSPPGLLERRSSTRPRICAASAGSRALRADGRRPVAVTARLVRWRAHMSRQLALRLLLLPPRGE